MTTLDALPAAGPDEPDLDRRRGWWRAAIVVLLVAVYLAWWVTYAQLHLPPRRYEQRPPGAVVSQDGADFTLVSLARSPALKNTGGEEQPAPPGAVWVVATMEITQRRVDPDLICSVVLVGSNGRSWSPPGLLGLARPTEDCLPDDAVLGRPYPMEVDFRIPATDANQIMGVAIPQAGTGRDPLLVPPH